MADPMNSDDKIREGDSIVDPLPQDNSTPFGPPTDPVDDAASDMDDRTESGRLDPMHQATDQAADIDQHEYYDEGLSGAAEAEEPNAGNAVTGYDPEKDHRRGQDAA